ncbi:MAG: phosphoribosyltransferase family protein [Balneolaceae bacterium]|nr:phosphoribosyltransferase family protein [Balneolaceae bacterium]
MDAEHGEILMNGDRVQRSLKRIAFQISEANRAALPVMLIGINRRGHVVARRLAEYLSPLYDTEVMVRQLDLEEGALTGEDPDEDHFIVLADDVIFSGHTMFQALSLLAERLQPKEVHTVTLIDRGHRKMPVEAQFCGLTIPTKLNEHVRVNVEEDAIRNVELTRGV